MYELEEINKMKKEPGGEEVSHIYPRYRECEFLWRLIQLT